MEDISIKAYAQWVTIDIINTSSKEVVIKNVHLPWGKFYRDGKPSVSSTCVMEPDLDHMHYACNR